MLRQSATPVIHRYWESIDKFDRLYSETGDVNYLNQLNGLKKQVMEIMANVKNEETLREAGRSTGSGSGDSLSRW